MDKIAKIKKAILIAKQENDLELLADLLSELSAKRRSSIKKISTAKEAYGQLANSP